MPTTTTLQTGLAGAIGCDLRLADDRLFFVEYATGKLSSISAGGGGYTVHGSGYAEPEDIALAGDGSFAYVTERAGNLLRVALPSAPRSAAHVVATGMTAPQQLALDSLREQAYVVEYAPSGRLFRINLATGAKTIVASGLQGAVGVIVKSDLSYAYVSQQGAGNILRIRLSDGHRDVLVDGLTNPFFLTWADDAESAFYFTERDPVNRLRRVDLITGTAAVLSVVPARPSCVAVKSGSDLLVCCNDEVVDVAFTPYASAGPLLLGIGLIPFTTVDPATGLATTDPSYLLPVTDAPFGGGLAVMINHDRARTLGAVYYKLDVDGAEPRQSFTDYLWNGTTFALETVSADASGYYPVRSAGALWYNPWLGYDLDSSVVSNAVHTMRVQFFNDAHALVAQESHVLRVDNRLPTASIDDIYQNHVVIPACGNATAATGPDLFSFRVSGSHPEHLASWALSALWGVNQSASIASGSDNVSGVVPAAQWSAAVPGDPSSTACGHTFVFGVWDRVTNGYGSIHYQEATETIDIRF